MFYLIIPSVVCMLGLFDSNLRFLTTGALDAGFAVPPLPKTESDATTTVSVKFDVVNFCPRTSFVALFAETGTALASVCRVRIDKIYYVFLFLIVNRNQMAL